MGAVFQGFEKGVCGCLDLGENLLGGGSGGSNVRVRDVGDDTTHWEGFGRIPPQGGPKDDGMTTSDQAGRWVGVFPTGRSDG